MFLGILKIYFVFKLKCYYLSCMKKTTVGRPKVKERRIPVTFMAGGPEYNDAVKKHGKKYVNHTLELTVMSLAKQEKSK